MKLSRRLEAIVELIPSTQVIADIGTDHGFVPCALLKRGRIHRAIAADINRLPLEKARTTATLQGLADQIEFRLGSGLKVLAPGEVNGAIIAGMGGELTRDILEASPAVVQTLDFLILQPAQNPEVLRGYLYGGGWAILAEDLVREEDGRFYEYFVVRRDASIPADTADPLDHLASPRLIRERHPLMAALLEARIRELDAIRGKLDPSFPSTRARLLELGQQTRHYQEELTWLSR